MEIREIREEEMERSVYIGRQAFAHGARGGSSWLQDPNRPTTTRLGAWDEGGMQARVNIIHYQVYLGADVVVPMGGIGGVACLPASRGKGYVGALLDETLKRMKDEGLVISSLYPFSWAFYRRYGWEWVGLNRTYSVPSRLFSSHPETEGVRAAQADETRDRAAINDCYARFAGRYRGLVVRDEKKWNSILKDEDDKFTYTYLYEKDGQAEGYMVVRGGTGEETWIRELIVLTPRAHHAMLGLLRRQDMQTKKFTWSAPGNDPLYHQLCHNDVETKVEPMTQGRIVDVAGAFAAWQPNREARGAVTMEVADEHARWNTGTWRVEFEAGDVSIQRTSAPPQISLSIQALSQAYYGTPSIEEIRAAEHITVQDESGYAAFRALLDGPPMWTNDHF